MATGFFAELECLARQDMSFGHGFAVQRVFDRAVLEVINQHHGIAMVVNGGRLQELSATRLLN